MLPSAGYSWYMRSCWICQSGDICDNSYLPKRANPAFVNVRLFQNKTAEDKWRLQLVRNLLNLFVTLNLERRGWSVTHLSASFWSCSSKTPSLFWMRCSRLVPWKPLPRPSQRTTTALKLLASTVAQSMWNCSVTTWPPGVPSLHTGTTQCW